MKTIVVCLLFTSSLFAQSRNAFVGDWSGKLQVNVGLRLVLHITDSAGMRATIDSPDQNAYNIQSDSIILNGDSTIVHFRKLRAKYKAKLIKNDSVVQLLGIWQQGSYQFPLTMVKGSAPNDVRPQNPKPPFNYRSEDILYKNNTGSVTLAATLTIPHKGGKHPAIILISGSGPQDRDETIFGHKPFWVIADYLTRHGYAVLRVDDRGVGKSKGETARATSADFAQDVITSIDYLSTRAEIDKKQIGLLGHSEGGIIAPMVAVQRKIAFMILLAAPAVKGSELLDEQRVALLMSSGLSTSAASEYRTLSKRINEIIIQSKNKEEAIIQTEQEINRWQLSASAEAKTALSLGSPENAKSYAVQSVNQMYVPWFRFFLAYNPAKDLMQSRCPVLALFGEKDIQVLSTQNMKPMESILKQSRKSGAYMVREIKGVNHLFQHCDTCTLSEYASLAETFSESVMKEIAEWLDSIRG